MISKHNRVIERPEFDVKFSYGEKNKKLFLKQQVLLEIFNTIIIPIVGGKDD